uniref:uncharacterized protein LOC122583099 n=1 Tax=Erigeron canadensis TaxID=72917 RepID=UPI001CB911D2|nr:uncharacterized protein LOC122583099 [Erigeron canadensis]
MVKINNVGIDNLLKGEVRNGTEISFWLDRWACNESLRSRFPVLFKLERDKIARVAERFSLEENRFNGAWNWERSPSDPATVCELDSLTRLLNGITIDNKPERWTWLGGVDNVLSIQNVKDFLLGDKDFSDRFVFDWINWVPKNCNVFMWRVSMDRIPTMVAMRARNCFALDPVCVLCGEEDETVEHLFCKCETAARVWHFISKWCKTAPFFIFDIKDLPEFHETLRKDKKEKDVLKGLIIISCWCI